MGDEAAGDFEERFADVGSSLPPDAQAAEGVQPRKTPFHDRAVGAQSGAVQSAAAGERGHEAVPVGDQGVLRAGPAPVDRRRACADAPFSALTWEEPTTQRDRSRREAALSPASRTSCSRCQTPVPRTAPARHARAEPQLLRQVPPLDTGMQHVQDPAQHLPVRQCLTARMTEPALTLRQQWFKAAPQFIRHDPRQHPRTGPNAQFPPRTQPSGPSHLIAERAPLRSRWSVFPGTVTDNRDWHRLLCRLTATAEGLWRARPPRGITATPDPRKRVGASNRCPSATPHYPGRNGKAGYRLTGCGLKPLIGHV